MIYDKYNECLRGKNPLAKFIIYWLIIVVTEFHAHGLEAFLTEKK